MLTAFLIALLTASSGASLEAPTPPTATFAPQAPDHDSTRLALLNITDLIGAEQPSLDPEENQRRMDATTKLVEVIRTKLPPEASDQLVALEPGPLGSILVEGGPAYLDFVTAFLEAQRHHSALVSVELSLIEAPRELLGQLGVEGPSLIFDEASSYQELLSKLTTAEGIEVISTPKVGFRVRSGGASISTMNQIAYVSDYELRIVEPGHQELLDPVIDELEEGFLVRIAGVPMPGGIIDFDVDVEFSKLARPIPTEMIQIGPNGDHEVEVSRPELAKVSIKALLSMRPGSAALITSAAPDEGRDFIVILHIEELTNTYSERVELLFNDMAAGTYAQRWFPPLAWDDIPALLDYAPDKRAFESYPRSPLGDLQPPSIVAGVCALWFIEGLREDGHYASFAPLLMDEGEPLDASPKRQRALLGRATAAYRTWFREFTEGRLSKGAPCPLDAIGLSWY